MTDLDDFLARVMPKMAELSDTKFSHVSWPHGGRPTSEGVGRLQEVSVDPDKMAARIMDVAGYKGNIQYVDESRILEQPSANEVKYLQRVNLPVLGGLQMVLNLKDLGDVNGQRVIGWWQDEQATAALDKKQGARTEYNLGAWLITPDAVSYALASAPVKKDVGTLKFIAMTKGADATAGTVLQQNIKGMIDWTTKVG